MTDEEFINYKIRKLTDKDLRLIKNLCENCSDYYLLDQGKPAGPNATKDILKALPPNKTYEDKYVFGLFDEKDDLSALIDLIEGFPKDNTWMLGLFLVSPDKRRLGLGKYFHKEIVKLIKNKGAKTIRIGVLDDNLIALKFWKSLDYKFENESKTERADKRIKLIKIYSLGI